MAFLLGNEGKLSHCFNVEGYSNGPFRKLTDNTKLIYPPQENFCALTLRDGQKARPGEPLAQKPRVGLSRRAEHHPVHDPHGGQRYNS